MKGALRLRFRALRDALPPRERRTASAEIWERLVALPEFMAANTILFYASVGSEVETRDMVEGSRALGKRIALPRMNADHLRLHGWEGARPLVPNRFGILEPTPDSPLVNPEDVDLAVVPGVAFDRRGARLGYGGGFYDRLLRSLPRVRRVGVAFEAQVVPDLPSTHLDCPMDVLVTEVGLIQFRRRDH